MVSTSTWTMNQANITQFMTMQVWGLMTRVPCKMVPTRKKKLNEAITLWDRLESMILTGAQSIRAIVIMTNPALKMTLDSEPPTCLSKTTPNRTQTSFSLQKTLLEAKRTNSNSYRVLRAIKIMALGQVRIVVLASVLTVKKIAKGETRMSN